MSKKHEFRKVIDLLSFVSPYCLALWFEKDQHVCASASAGAAQALRMLGVDAQPIFVSAIAGNEDVFESRAFVSLGHNKESSLPVVRKYFGVIPTLDSTHVTLDGGHEISEATRAYPFHVAVRVRHGAAVWLLDLTVGQINGNTFGIQLPGSLYMEGEWPAYRFDNGMWIFYDKPPYPDKLDPKILQCEFNGLAEDLRDSLLLAMRLGPEQAKLVLEQVLPQAFADKRALARKL